MIDKIKTTLISIWEAWSHVQDHEDSVWNATVSEESDTVTADSEDAPCSTGSTTEPVPSLASLVAERNREQGTSKEHK